MKRYKRWRLRRRINIAAAVLVKLNQSMIDMDVPRHVRKRIWSDFVKSPERRMDIINALEGVIT